VRELHLIRASDDKRRVDLEGVGSVRFTNMWGTKLTISAAGHGEWHLARSRRGTSITDTAGVAVAQITAAGVVHDGRVIEVTSPHQGMLERRPPFVISENGREIATAAPQIWSEKPLAVTIIDDAFATAEPLLFLLALYRAQLIAASRFASAPIN
jgi:hypothetical protein